MATSLSFWTGPTFSPEVAAQRIQLTEAAFDAGTGGAIDFYFAMLKLEPRREVQLARKGCPPIVIASDARVEPGTYPGGKFLVPKIIRRE